MNFNEIIGLDEIEEFGNWESFKNYDDLVKFINIIKQFDSYEKLFQFISIMKSIPTISQVTELTHSNTNLNIFEVLKSQGYFNLLDPIQKYHLFVEACSHDSIDICMLIFSTSIDLEGVKEFMQNYLVQVGTNTEYIIFRKIWEKNIIQFNQQEIEEMFFNILRTSNIDFIEWVFSLNLINLRDSRIKKQIGCEILTNTNNNNDFKIAMLICSQYIK
jgi:hypothetical protein